MIIRLTRANTPEQVLSQEWAEHLASADAEWLIPILRELEAGRKFDADLVAYCETQARQRGVDPYMRF